MNQEQLCTKSVESFARNLLNIPKQLLCFGSKSMHQLCSRKGDEESSLSFTLSLVLSVDDSSTSSSQVTLSHWIALILRLCIYSSYVSGA